MGMLAAVYAPAESVVSSRTNPFCGLDTVTCAPGMAAPDGSVAMPTMVAVSCAIAPSAKIEQTTTNSTVRCDITSLLPKKIPEGPTPVRKDIRRGLLWSGQFLEDYGTVGEMSRLWLHR